MQDPNNVKKSSTEEVSPGAVRSELSTALLNKQTGQAVVEKVIKDAHETKNALLERMDQIQQSTRDDQNERFARLEKLLTGKHVRSP